MFDLGATTDIGDVVEVALGIGLLEVDGGRYLSVLHGDERGSDTGSATCALRVADLGFQSRHRDVVGVVAESELERARLDAVVEFGGRAVQVDIIHVGGGDACVRHCHANCARRFFATFFQAHTMKGFAGGAVAGDLGVNGGTARL